jgi:plastocyanin domain-containing protein
MPCGPLQAMQLYALSTGSPITGALAMLLFSLGTVPLMFGLGALSSVLSKKFTRKVMSVGAALVVVLGLSMFSNGWSLSGFSLDFLSGVSGLQKGSSAAGAEVSDIAMEDGVQLVSSSLSSGRYPAITVQAGTPVKWMIDAPEGSVNGCNNRMIIPEYDIEYSFKTGENVIEFTPTDTGKFRYSCWMGMIRSSITVVEPGALPEGTASGSSTETGAEGSLYNDTATTGEPVPANVIIATENIAVAELGTIDAADGEEYDVQRVSIDLTDDGYNAAIIVVQAEMDVEWTINNESTADSNSILLVPLYNTALYLEEGENPLYLFPTEEFAFSNGDSTFFGYVKVVEDLAAIDSDAIKAEAAAYKTLIYPPETFDGGGSGASCH